MNTLIWNARGVDNLDTINYIKTLKSQHNPALVVILEPKIHGERIQNVARQVGFKLAEKSCQ